MRAAAGPSVGRIDALLANSRSDFDAGAPRLLAPCDLQAIKAAGVTFVASTLERVIEEQARGDAEPAPTRYALGSQASLGDDLASVRPDPADATRIKQVLVEQGAWSQYLEVGIGPDAEIFTKTQPMASGWPGCADRRASRIRPGTIPEPEIVLGRQLARQDPGRDPGQRRQPARTSKAAARCCSAKAKDNNASCAIGPFIRALRRWLRARRRARNCRDRARRARPRDGFHPATAAAR